MPEADIMVRASHSILVVGDAHAMPPSSMGGMVAAATPDCVAISTLMSDDGETRVRVTDRTWPASQRPERLAFKGTIKVASHILTIEDAELHRYLEWPVAIESVSLQIWINHPREPDDILILTGGLD
ncbi:MAG TPA: hypothetical protein VGD57_06405 [Candidatus Dormibacteraeota bacterium]|jgi:hypothetical protein